MFAIWKRSRYPLVMVALIASPWMCVSQSGQIGIATKANADEIEKWLDSSDPRLVAWGAYFARESGDSSAMAALLELVDEWTAADHAGDGASRLNSDSMAEILDALIQRNVAVPREDLLVVGHSFPAQAAILASRLSTDDARPLLQTWYKRRGYEGRWNGQQPMLARIAAMMLAKAPPPGFAASVLAEAKERITISVVDPGIGVGGGGSGCRGSYGVALREGWPPIFGYVVTENPQDMQNPVLVEGGGDRLVYARSDSAQPGLRIRSLNDETRHGLLLEMLGEDRSALQWKPDEFQSWEWHGAGNFQTDLEELVRAESAKLRETVNAFLDKGLLTADEAGSSMPRLLVVVDDDRENKVSELPQFDSSDPHVTVLMPSKELTSFSID